MSLNLGWRFTVMLIYKVQIKIFFQQFFSSSMSATCTIEKSRENEMRIFFGNIKWAKERERMKTN